LSKSRRGGTTYLAEFPELCNVEQELIDRCVSNEKAKTFEILVRDYAAKAEAVGAGFDMNPSAGNLADPLTCGCARIWRTPA